MVVKELEAFAIKPTRERHCRTLKQVAHTTAQRQGLWYVSLTIFLF
jgi:hypothetical protein